MTECEKYFHRYVKNNYFATCENEGIILNWGCVRNILKEVLIWAFKNKEYFHWRCGLVNFMCVELGSACKWIAPGRRRVDNIRPKSWIWRWGERANTCGFKYLHEYYYSILLVDFVGISSKMAKKEPFIPFTVFELLLVFLISAFTEVYDALQFFCSLSFITGSLSKTRSIFRHAQAKNPEVILNFSFSFIPQVQSCQ